MAFIGVPWAIRGAEVTEETARFFANVATRDSQGVALPGHFKVTALGTPGAAVNIAPGGMVLRNAQAPGQSYVGAATTQTQVPVPANNTGSPVSHLIIARVRDPLFAPWQPYSDPNQILRGPYFEPHVQTNVSGTAKTPTDVGITYTAEALARIDMPAGAQVVEGQYIKEAKIRKLALPRNGFATDVQRGPTYDEMLTSQTTYRHFPTNSIGVDIPTWATHAEVEIRLSGIAANGPGDIDFRVRLGDLSPSALTYFDYNGNEGTPAGFVEILERTLYGEFEIPADMRGDEGVVVKPEGVRTFRTQNTGKLWMDLKQQVGFRVTFTERIV